MPVGAHCTPVDASAFPLSANAATIVRTSATRNFVRRARVYEDFEFTVPLPRAAVARMKRAAPGRVSTPSPGTSSDVGTLVIKPYGTRRAHAAPSPHQTFSSLLLPVTNLSSGSTYTSRYGARRRR